MILHSRFKDLYQKWSKADRILLIDKINVLIHENSAFADSKNYGFMCNLLSSLAIIQVLEDKHMPRKEAQQYVADAMYSFIE